MGEPDAAVTGSHIQHAAEMMQAAADASKCWACGCLRHALDAIDNSQVASSDAGALALASAREHLQPQKYECLGCATCFPAVALNVLVADGSPAEGAACPTEAVTERKGWPPLPGDYTVLRYHAPVAVCTLNDIALATAVASSRLADIAIVGTLHTENLGIERLIANVLANPHIRFVVVCGSESRQAIGHLPGQTLAALAQNGLNEHQRIVGAKGKRPILRNIAIAVVEDFRRTREVVDLVGVSDLETILSAVRDCAARNPGAAELTNEGRAIIPIAGSIPARMVSDPAGYFVIYPDRSSFIISLEHYGNTGVLTTVIEGRSAAELYMTVIDRNLISRLDHAAYLGRELARAEHALRSGEAYVQDAAPEALTRNDCGCSGECESRPRAELRTAPLVGTIHSAPNSPAI